MSALFLIGGASGTGKTAICNRLAGSLDKVVALDGDIIWSCGNFTPEKTEAFYDFCLRLCGEIAKSGVSVALFHAGAGVPGNIMGCEAAKLFSEIRFMGLYCSDEALEARLSSRLEWQDQDPSGFINAMKGFNAMYRFYDQPSPRMEKLDTTDISLDESTKRVSNWIAGQSD